MYPITNIVPSLIKMLYWMCERSGMSPTWIQLQHAILRNFGGLEEKNLNPMEEFASRIHSKTAPDLTNTSDEVVYSELLILSCKLALYIL